MEYIIVSDTSIVAVNRGTKDNESSNIVYRDNGELHTIDFETFANNYQSEHNGASRYCIGERKIDEATLFSIQAEQKPKLCLIRCMLVTFLPSPFFQAIKIFVFLVCRTTSTKRNTTHVTFLKITLLSVVHTSTYTPFGRSFAEKDDCFKQSSFSLIFKLI